MILITKGGLSRGGDSEMPENCLYDCRLRDTCIYVPRWADEETLLRIGTERSKSCPLVQVYEVPKETEQAHTVMFDRKTEPNSSEKPNNCETQIDELKEAKILLKASRNLLNKQNETIYVLNLLEETVEYHGTECDGYCLIDDIDDWLLQTEPQTDVYDYKGNGKWERSE